jgi:hypothetical protein
MGAAEPEQETIEGTAVEVSHVPAVIPTVPPSLSVVPSVPASELVERLDVIKQAMTTAMVRDIDYGIIPGTGTKPTLLKPGAEKLAVLFQFDVQTAIEKTWGPGDHLTADAKVTVFHAPTGARLGGGEGMCSTREKKYGKRKQERLCPQCGKPAVIQGKAEYGGGWLCWKKRDGCNAKFADNDPQIVGQETGEIDNPDLPDMWNTVVKMAKKRGIIDAILLTTGASAMFTQDLEDTPLGPPPPSEPPAPPALVSKEDIEELKAASHKVPVKQIRLTLGELGLPAPELPEDLFVGVPLNRAAALVSALNAVRAGVRGPA